MKRREAKEPQELEDGKNDAKQCGKKGKQNDKVGAKGWGNIYEMKEVVQQVRYTMITHNTDLLYIYSPLHLTQLNYWLDSNQLLKSRHHALSTATRKL